MITINNGIFLVARSKFNPTIWSCFSISAEVKWLMPRKQKLHPGSNAGKVFGHFDVCNTIDNYLNRNKQTDTWFFKKWMPNE